jgi:hypothetical protein
VQKIVEDAADAIAAEAPFEEEVVITVEELPPTEGAAARRAAASGQDASGVMVGIMASGQELLAASINRWSTLFSLPRNGSAGAGGSFAGVFDPQHIMREGFRMAEEILDSQKQLALRLADAMERRPAS